MYFRKKRKYAESYFNFRFTLLTAGRVEKNSLLEHGRLKRHLETKHCCAINRDEEYLKRQADRLVKSRLDDTGMCMQDIAAGLKASYAVSRKNAAAKNPLKPLLQRYNRIRVRNYRIINIIHFPTTPSVYESLR